MGIGTGVLPEAEHAGRNSDRSNSWRGSRNHAPTRAGNIGISAPVRHRWLRGDDNQFSRLDTDRKHGWCANIPGDAGTSRPDRRWWPFYVVLLGALIFSD